MLEEMHFGVALEGICLGPVSIPRVLQGEGEVEVL